jgi:hypothetical protein
MPRHMHHKVALHPLCLRSTLSCPLAPRVKHVPEQCGMVEGVVMVVLVMRIMMVVLVCGVIFRI